MTDAGTDVIDPTESDPNRLPIPRPATCPGRISLALVLDGGVPPKMNRTRGIAAGKAGGPPAWTARRANTLCC
jgi:hypothetical protein